MNLYLLLEGVSTEPKVYPYWLSILVPRLIQINDVFKLKDESDLDNTFFTFSCNGFPSIVNIHLPNAVKEVNQIEKIDYLLVCLDCDEDNVERRAKYIEDFLSTEKLTLKSAELVIIPQNKCFETWLLGNRKVYSQNATTPELVAYNKHYNVRTDDPELMKSGNKEETCSQFHFSYLKKMLAEKNLRYSKNNPQSILSENYLNELINRCKDTGHISSFGNFIAFCNSISKKKNK